MFEFQKFYRNKFWLGKTCESPGLEKTSMYFGSLIGQSNPFSNINFNFQLADLNFRKKFYKRHSGERKALEANLAT